MFVKVKYLIKRLPVLLLCVLMSCLSGCNKVKQIKVTSVALESVGLCGFKGLDVGLAIGIDNPAFGVDISEIEGALKHSGKVLGRVSLDPFRLHGRSAEIYHLRALVTLEKGVGIQEILPYMNKDMLEQCTFDVSAKATYKKTVSKVFAYKDMPVKKLLERNVYEEK